MCSDKILNPKKCFKRTNMCKEAVREIRSKEYNIDNVREAAELILKDYSDGSVTPIVKIINDAGFKIYLQELPQNIGGYIVLSDEIKDKFGTDKIIVLNNSNTAKRRRFTLAHEFGHFLIDPNARNVIEYYNAFEDDNNGDDNERIINRFAAELLMPKEAFIQKKAEIGKDDNDFYEIVRKLSEHFQVPTEAIKRRFDEVAE